MEKLNFISINVRGLHTDEKREKHKFMAFFLKKIDVELLQGTHCVKHMSVNTTLVEKGTLFMHVVIQYLVEVFLFFLE